MNLKMINIQKSYSVYIGSIRFILFSSVQFGPIQSILSAKVLFGLIQSTSAPISPHQSHSIHFGLIQSILSTLVLFGLLCLLWFYFILLGPHWSNPVHSIHFDPLQSYSDHSVGPIWFILSTLVLLGPIQITLILFGPLRSSMSILVLFDPICSILVHSVHFGPFVLIQSNSSSSIYCLS